jgi:hypothetical protein
MDDLHDQLVKAYLDYFQKNELWESSPSVRKYYEVQKSIRKVRDLSELRHKEIRNKHQTRKDKNKE